MPLINYLSFYFQASTKYQIHSPFVFDFVENVLEDPRQYYFFSTIEKYRRILLSDKSAITNSTDKINSLTRKLAIKKATGCLLFRMVHHYKPKEILSLGVFPGLAALYQSTPSYKTPLIGLESNEAVAQQLNHYFKEVGVPNIALQYGALNELIPKVLATQSLGAYIYIKEVLDRKTLATILAACHAESILIIERPYRNKEVLETWNWLKNKTSVKISLDLYHLGILFFRKEQKEQAHYQLIRSALKPWSVF